MKLDQITEIIKISIKDAYDEGFVDGSTKQAILELQGRDRFLEQLRASQPPVEADVQSRCECQHHEISFKDGSNYCQSCGKLLRTA